MAKGRGTLCTSKPKSRISPVELLNLFNPMCIFIFFFQLISPTLFYTSLLVPYPTPHPRSCWWHIALGFAEDTFNFPFDNRLNFGADSAAGVKLTLKVVGRLIAGYHQVPGWNVWAFAISRQLKLLNIRTNMFSPAPSPSRPFPLCSSRKSEEHASPLGLGSPWLPLFGSLISTWKALYPRSPQ